VGPDILFLAVGYSVGAAIGLTARWAADRLHRPRRSTFEPSAALLAPLTPFRRHAPRADTDIPTATDLAADKVEVARRILERRYAREANSRNQGPS
jgi:hypothetical protein